MTCETAPQPSFVSMLVQRRKRWSNIEANMGKWLLFPVWNDAGGALQSQNTVAVHLKNKQILPFLEGSVLYADGEDPRRTDRSTW